MTPNAISDEAESTAADERRASPRVSADFYAVELRGPSRYFRLVRNVSRHGLLIVNPMADEQPGQVLDLEIPRPDRREPLKVRAQVVYVSATGRVGVRILDPDELLDLVAGSS